MPALAMPKPRYALRAAVLRRRPEKTLVDDESTVSNSSAANQCISDRITGSEDSNRQYESAPQSPLLPVQAMIPDVSNHPPPESQTDSKTPSSCRPTQLTTSPLELLAEGPSSAYQRQDYVTRPPSQPRANNLDMDLEALKQQIKVIQQQQQEDRLERQRMEQERRSYEKTIMDQIQRMEKVLQASHLLATPYPDGRQKQPRRQRSYPRRPPRTADEDTESLLQPHTNVSRRSSQSSRYHPSDDDTDGTNSDVSPQLSRNSSTGSRPGSVRTRRRSRSIESHTTWPPPPTGLGEVKPSQTRSLGRHPRSLSLPRSPQPEYHSAVEDEDTQESPRRRRLPTRRPAPQTSMPGFLYGYQLLGGDPYFSHGPHPLSYTDEGQPWAGPPLAAMAAATLGWPPPPNHHAVYTIPPPFPHPFASRENNSKEQGNGNQDGKGPYRRSRPARHTQQQQHAPAPPGAQPYHPVYATDGPPINFM
ncbi:hypothetical protein EC973_004771 [Apophysomyces ossiformis]|uniref:Uncharacterized protein n=1 Tax=Apophysomyces ossiformis TaxID=679940 RepID=A0A8H7BX85_9FUNG|nr:hypothetical protein EC973_004771 [Apophysomyces ossiformis]